MEEIEVIRKKIPKSKKICTKTETNLKVLENPKETHDLGTFCALKEENIVNLQTLLHAVGKLQLENEHLKKENEILRKCFQPTTSSLLEENRKLKSQNFKLNQLVFYYSSTSSNQMNYIYEDSTEIISLPTEILIRIFNYLENRDACNIRLVCYDWKEIIDEFPPKAWKRFSIQQTNVKIDSLFPNFFRRFRFVEMLELYSIDSVSHFHFLIEKFPLLKKVRITVLSSEYDTDIRNLCVGISEGLKDNCKLLEEILLPFVFSARVFQNFSSFSNLKTLLYSNSVSNDITDHEVELLASNCKHLQVLSLNGCLSITDNSLKCLSICCPDLIALDLSLTLISDYGLKCLSQRCTQLQFLLLQACTRTSFSTITRIKGLQELFPSLIDPSIFQSLLDFYNNLIQ